MCAATRYVQLPGRFRYVIAAFHPFQRHQQMLDRKSGVSQCYLLSMSSAPKSLVTPHVRSWSWALAGQASQVLGQAAAFILVALCSGLALGSWWSMVPPLLFTVLFIRRAAVEDRLLREELEGYSAYAEKVRYRLVPGLW